MTDDVERDVATVARIEAVPGILRTVRAFTGLRVALVARTSAAGITPLAILDEAELGWSVGETRAPLPSVIAVPVLRRSGERFGELAAADPELDLRASEETRAMLAHLAELVAMHLEVEERRDGQLHEQFLAILAHDVRNPLSSIAVGTELLLARAADPATRRTLERVRGSTKRIGDLVDDLLDLARGRFGSGLVLDLLPAEDLPVRLRHVVDEVQSSHEGRVIHVVEAPVASVHCDAGRIEQLLSNLLANALDHGAVDVPIEVAFGTEEGRFTLSVTNGGEAIPADALPRLFEPYYRRERKGGSGLGLGLYIVSEIAKAHGGRIEVYSDSARTTFRLSMPRDIADSAASSYRDVARAG